MCAMSPRSDKCVVMCMQEYNVCPYAAFPRTTRFIILCYTVWHKPSNPESWNVSRRVAILVNLHLNDSEDRREEVKGGRRRKERFEV